MHEGSNDEADKDLISDIYGKDFVDFRAWLISVQLKSTNPKAHIKYQGALKSQSYMRF